VGDGETQAGESVGLPRLPPGRHGLSREFVVKNQRERMTAGMIRVVVDEGYGATTVSKVVKAAGISRRTFYNNFSDKEEAFADAYGQVTDFLFAAMKEAGAAPGRRSWPARVRAEIEALLESFAANPDLVVFCLVAPPAAGGEVAGLYRAFLEGMLQVLRDGKPAKIKNPPPAAEYGLVGGLAARIVASLGADPADLSTLLPEAVELVLTPYIGREAAAAAAR
jgi:AcrR family transcriptional regulator